MGTEFQAEVATWGDFYSLLGGAAAALLGLLFVALSLRLGIFRKHREDIQDNAALAFATLLVTIGVSALMLAPNRDRASTAITLTVVAVVGLAADWWVWRVMQRLIKASRAPEPLSSGALRWVLRHTGGCIGLLLAAWLIWIGHLHGLGVLAFVTGFLLASGSTSIWMLLANTANDSPDDAG
ncbi:MAG: hypothetical protein U0075_19235 [Thermomicrobiales bacterium]